MSAASVPFGADDLERLRRDHPHTRVVDVRSPAEFSGRRIPGSCHVPLAELGDHMAELTSPEDGPVVLVCESGRRAQTAQRRLAEAGQTSAHVLTGGVAAWEAQGLALVRAAGPAPWALERQVRLVAGGMVAGAIAASRVWPPARFLAGAIGVGLVVAALTDTCAMGAVLARMPYNTRSRPVCGVPSPVVGAEAAGEAA
jgi:rhodanese-related sulfurtransferase